MNTEPRTKKLRWFQFGLRDMLAIALACAILLTWWSDRERLLGRVRHLEGDLTMQAQSEKGAVLVNLGLDDGLEAGLQLDVSIRLTSVEATRALGIIVPYPLE
jgi:hypothetical protein